MEVPLNNRGVVALITSIVVGLLLVIITSSAVALMGGELRNAADFDQSVKAYFAAESGMEDAINHIKRELEAGAQLSDLISDDCAPYDQNDANLSGDPERVISYTCQTVSVEQNEILGTLAPEESVQIDLTGIASFNQIQLEWNQAGSTDPQGWDKLAIPNSFPPGQSWHGVYPAVMELTIITFPKSATFDSSSITSKTYVLKPAAAGGSSSLNINPPNSSAPTMIDCNPTTSVGTYACSVGITPFDNSTTNYILRLQARYSQANYEIKSYQGSTQQTIPNAQLSIDVTGKAGDVFRRVLAKTPLGPQPQGFVILANENICKLLEVTDTDEGSQASSDCPGDL